MLKCAHTRPVIGVLKGGSWVHNPPGISGTTSEIMQLNKIISRGGSFEPPESPLPHYAECAVYYIAQHFQWRI